MAVLFGMPQGDSKSAWIEIVTCLSQGKTPSPALFVTAFEPFVSNSYKPITQEPSGYAKYSRSMVDVMRTLQDIVESLSIDPSLKGDAFQQFLTFQSWLVPTTYVGRMGLKNGVNFANLLKIWLVSTQIYFSTKVDKKYNEASKSLELWLRKCYGDDAGNLWSAYTTFVHRKHGYHTSYLDNLPAIGFIIDQHVDKGKPNRTLHLNGVLIRSRMDVLPSMPIQEARTPEQYNYQIGMLLASHTPTISTALIEDQLSDDLLLAHGDIEAEDGDLVDSYLYSKASGKEEEANRIQGEIFSRSSDMEVFEQTLSERNRKDVSSTLANYENEAAKRVGELVGRFRVTRGYHIDFSQICVEGRLVM
jgi:hypothetical protein